MFVDADRIVFAMSGWSLATLMLTNYELLGAIEERQWMVLNVRWLHETTAKVMDEIWTWWYDSSASTLFKGGVQSGLAQ